MNVTQMAHGNKTLNEIKKQILFYKEKEAGGGGVGL